MSLNAVEITQLVQKQLAQITDIKDSTLVESLLIPPRCEQRPWDQRHSSERYPCWIVAEHRPSEAAFAYCEDGLRPHAPWGLLWISGDYTTMSLHSQWFPSLEEAVRESFAWPEPLST